MSNIPHNFIDNIGFLYESISLEEKDFMNEQSAYYDAEAVEMIEEIISAISLSMICEGYSASSIISFLADSSDQDIIEKYLNFDENLITENNIPDEYIIEQIDILESVSNLILERRGVTKALQGLKGLFSTAKRSPALKSAGPLSPKAATNLAMKGKPTLMTKARVGTERLIGPKGRKAVQSVKDFGTKAKAALPTVAKAALVGGLGVLGGYAGTKLAGAGGDGPGVPGGGKEGPGGDDSGAGVVKDYAAFRAGGGGAKSRKTGMNIRDVEALGRKNLAALKSKGGTPAPAPAAPALPAPSGNGGGVGGSGRSSSAAPAPKKPDAAPSAPAPTDGAERRAATSLELRRAQEARAAALQAGKSKSEAEKAAVQAGIDASKPTQGSTASIPDLKSVNTDLAKSNTKAELEKPAPAGSALAAEQERRKRAQQVATSNTTNESYDAYDIVLEYLINTNQVDNLDEAHYVMLEMDSETIGSIVEASQVRPVKTRPQGMVKPSSSQSSAQRQRPPVGATVSRYGSDGTVYTHVQR